MTKYERALVRAIRKRNPFAAQRTLARKVAGQEFDVSGDDYLDAYGVTSSFAAVYGFIRRLDARKFYDESPAAVAVSLTV